MLGDEAIPAANIVAMVTAVSAGFRYPKLMQSLGKLKLRPMGIPFRASKVLQDLVSMSVFFSIGLTFLQIFRTDVPIWASTFVPGLTTVLILIYVTMTLWPRETFKPARFFELVLCPALANISPSWPAILSAVAAVGP